MTLDLSALPMWRKIIGSAAIAAFAALSFMSFVREMDIWSAGARIPNAATGQVYALHWMHGSVEYVTAADRSNFVFWYSDVGSLIGVAFLIGVFSLFPISDVLREARESGS